MDLIGNLLDTLMGAVTDLISTVLGIVFGALPGLPSLPAAPDLPPLDPGNVPVPPIAPPILVP